MQRERRADEVVGPRHRVFARAGGESRKPPVGLVRENDFAERQRRPIQMRAQILADRHLAGGRRRVRRVLEPNREVQPFAGFHEPLRPRIAQPERPRHFVRVHRLGNRGRHGVDPVVEERDVDFAIGATKDIFFFQYCLVNVGGFGKTIDGIQSFPMPLVGHVPFKGDFHLGGSIADFDCGNKFFYKTETSGGNAIRRQFAAGDETFRNCAVGVGRDFGHVFSGIVS